jgi:predicted nucleotidyltransferase
MGLNYDTYRDYLDALIQRLWERFGEENLLGCALFGSVARGEASPDSDIDLLILHAPVPFSPLRAFCEVCDSLGTDEVSLGAKVRGLSPYPSPVLRTEQALRQNPLILLDVLNHGLLLYDKDGALRALLDRFSEVLRALGTRKRVLEDGSWAWGLKPDWRPGEVVEITL